MIIPLGLVARFTKVFKINPSANKEIRGRAWSKGRLYRKVLQEQGCTREQESTYTVKRRLPAVLQYRVSSLPVREQREEGSRGGQRGSREGAGRYQGAGRHLHCKAKAASWTAVSKGVSSLPVRMSCFSCRKNSYLKR